MLGGTHPLFYVLDGYAVLFNAAMPVVGPPASAYDTFIEQTVANAKAAIDKAVELGVTDPERVGVIGHSHGAMTATLLGQSDLFLRRHWPQRGLQPHDAALRIPK